MFLCSLLSDFWCFFFLTCLEMCGERYCENTVNCLAQEHNTETPSHDLAQSTSSCLFFIFLGSQIWGKIKTGQRSWFLVLTSLYCIFCASKHWIFHRVFISRHLGLGKDWRAWGECKKNGVQREWESGRKDGEGGNTPTRTRCSFGKLCSSLIGVVGRAQIDTNKTVCTAG